MFWLHLAIEFWSEVVYLDIRPKVFEELDEFSVCLDSVSTLDDVYYICYTNYNITHMQKFCT